MEAIVGYRISEILHDSAKSIVYRAYRQRDNSPVILKILKENHPSPESIAWFKREFEITRSIQLPNVSQVYGLETDHHRWIMILEDNGGNSLRDLGIIGKLSLEHFLKLAIKITDVLGQIHQRKIIHKDINPSNILYNPETQDVRFIDFGIASVLSHENATFRNPKVLEGTLAYMSPEQAGRMNRMMDYRTDFYSLGVTFFELLTGQLPFSSKDTLELVHSHIARQPTPPHAIRLDIPHVVSSIILKLMAKNAEDRYQSAHGLKTDLEHCLHMWETTGYVESFPLGQYDVSNHFHIPQKLYGREEEIDTLMTIFTYVSHGMSALMLISGYSGIGKSALIHELYKPVTRHRGYFISGKYDQFQRNIPYSAFIQAFRSLITHILTESDIEVARWKRRILQAVGKNGHVLIDVIPEIELIIGPQPEVVALGPAEALNRLNLVFQNFVKVFTQADHPLVIFLDDLQWADGASFQLMELLVTNPDSHYLFLIGAYRDNEVGVDHPLSVLIESLRQTHAKIFSMSLEPLDISGATQLIADTLLCKPENVASLAELVVEKTGGNPFFLNEFLKSLYTEGLITFVEAADGDWLSASNGHHRNGQSWYNSHGSKDFGWHWDIEHIKAKNMTDNVVELMASKIQRLDEQTQAILKRAASIGNLFDIITLSMVSELPVNQTASYLMPAVSEGLVLPLGETYKLMTIDVPGLTDNVTAEYKFAHDRIQQAVYSLIPEEHRQSFHWRIGQLLLTNIPESEHEERIFDIVNQFNQVHVSHRDSPLTIESHPSRSEVAHLNLKAGQKALASAAYGPALNYLTIGLSIVAERGWQHCYDLTLMLHKEYARCAYLNGHFEEAERVFSLILEQARTNLDKAEVYTSKMLLYTSLGKLDEVIETGLEGLKLLDLDIPLDPDQWMIDQEIQNVQMNLGDRNISDLLDLPNVTDPAQITKMKLLADMLIATWWLSNQQLLFLITLKMVNLSLHHGNTDRSPFGYAWYGMILGSGLGDYQAGYEFGRLALRLNEKYHSVHLIAKVNLIFAVFVQLWRLHLKKSLDFIKKGYQAGIESGDLVWAGINGYVIIYTMLIKGDELDHVYRESQRYMEFARRNRQVIPINMIKLSQQLILNLKGQTKAPGCFSDDKYDEDYHIKEIMESEAIRPIFWYYKIKLQSLYLFGHYHEALEIAQTLDTLIEEGAAFGNVTMPEHYLYYSLTLTALYPQATVEEQIQYERILQRNCNKMKLWAENCPENFLHKHLLLMAEQARLDDRSETAMLLYDRAIASARENEYLHLFALANELTAQFYLSKGYDSIASEYFHEARNGYLKWGATAKVNALDTAYAQLLVNFRPTAEAGTGKYGQTADFAVTTSSGLDLTTLMKALQVISGEMVLDTLLAKLMHIAIENAGAERGVLLLERQGRWVLESEGVVSADHVTVLQSVPIRTHELLALPETIINYVARTKQSLMLHDATDSDQFCHDRYIISKRPRSILCAPLLNQGKLTGMIYLENNLTTHAFTQERLEILNLIAGQAAISIQNALLYTTLEQSEQKYRTLFENSKDTIMMTTVEGEIIDINPAGLNLFDYTSEEISTTNVIKLYANSKDRLNFCTTIAEQGSVKDYPIVFRRKDGTFIHCLLTSSVWYNSDGAIAGYQGIIRDITEQKRIESERAALLDQYTRKAGELHAIIQSMADGILVVDVDERIMIVNPVAATLLGQEASALIDQPLQILTAVDDPIQAIGLQQIVDQVRNEMREPNRQRNDERISLGSRIIRLGSAPTRGTNDLLTGAVVVLQDITQEVESERAKNTFIATASHELRTPLTSLKGFVDLFYVSGIHNLTETQCMFLDTIKRQTSNLVQLVNDLLEVARLEQEVIRAEHRWVAPGTVIEESLEGFMNQLEQNRIYLHLHIEQHIPSIWIDSLHLRRICDNLISNAVKYVPQGGEISIRVYELYDPALLPSSPGNQVWKSQEERSIVIEIEDNGVGIRASDQPEIFNRFFRSENELSVQSGGSGLGLSITKSLVHLHNGQIGFRSVEHEGSCFWVRFPAPSMERMHNGREVLVPGYQDI